MDNVEDKQTKQFELNGKPVWLIKSKVQTDEDVENNCSSCDTCVFNYMAHDNDPDVCPVNEQKGMLECTLGDGVMHFTDVNPDSTKVVPSSASTSALNVQVGGEHYKDMKIQPVEYIHANNLSFLEGNVVKYITRHKTKNKAQDIRKIIHYCTLILQLEYNETYEQ